MSYYRDSGGDDQELSVAQQRMAVVQYCLNAGLTLTREFIDEARSGGSVVGRDNFLEMYRYLSTGDVPERHVIFWDIPRFARNYDDGSYFLAGLRRIGVELVNLKQFIPPGNIGRLVEAFYLVSAADFRDQLSANVKRGLAYVVQVHKAYPLPVTPTGLRKYPVTIGLRRDGRPHVISRLEPDPDRAHLVRRAFELRAQGLALSEIHDTTQLLNRRNAYQVLFHHEIYIGRFHYSGLVIDDFCDPIVELPLWDKVQDVNREWGERYNSSTPRRTFSPALLSGLVVCGQCGYRLNVQSFRDQWAEYRYYRCSSRSRALATACTAPPIRAGLLDDRVLARTLEFLTGDAYLQVIVDALRKELARDTGPDPLDRLRRELTENETARKHIADAVEKAPASTTLLNRLIDLEQAGVEMRRKIAQAEADGRRRASALSCLDPAAAQSAAGLELVKLEAPAFRDRQLALRRLIKEIRVIRSADELVGQITFRIPGTDLEARIPL